MTGTLTESTLAPDPELPQRDLLLDADRMATRLGGPAELVRVKYRVGESLRVTYRLADHRLVTGRAFSTVAAARAAAGTTARYDAELATAWWTFPHDRRLRGLADLPLPGDLVEYAPERSATFRVDGGYLKAYAPATVDVERLARRYAAVADHLAGRPLTPQPTRTWPQRGLLLLSVVPGVRWADLAPDDATARLPALGAAIAAVHGVPPPPRTAPFGRLRPDRIRTSAAIVARARPDVAGPAQRLAGRLTGGPPPAGSQVLLHGDCHPKNALVDGDRIGLIDLDQAGTGPAAADLGSLTARLYVDELLGGPPAAAGVDRTRNGYAKVRSLPAKDDLAWHTAAALLVEQAVRAVNRVRPAVLTRLADVLALGESLVADR